MLVSHIPSSPTTPSNGESYQSWISATDGSSPSGLLGDLTPEASPGIFLFDRLSGVVTFVGRGERVGGASADGRFVTFTSTSTTVIPGQIDSSPYTEDVFLYDRVSGTTTLVSHADGKPTTALSLSSYAAIPAPTATSRSGALGKSSFSTGSRVRCD